MRLFIVNDEDSHFAVFCGDCRHVTRPHQLNGSGSTWDRFDPILVMAFVFASYVLRRCMRANRWSI